MTAELVVVCVATVMSVVSTRFGVWYGSKKARAEIAHDDADAAHVLVNTALRLLDPYERRIEQLEKREIERITTVRRMHNRIDVLSEHLTALEIKLVELGHDPPPRPQESETT